MTEVRLALRPGISIADTGSGTVIETQVRSHTVPAALRAVMEALAAGRCSEQGLHDLARAADGDRGTTLLQIVLGQYTRLGLLRETLVVDDVALSALETFRGDRPSGAGGERLQPGARYRLSRFAVCRRDGDELLVESPLARVRLILCSPRAAAMMALLAVPRAAGEVCSGCGGLSPAASTALLEWFVAAKIAGVTNAGGAVAGDESAASWRAEDLLFHTRSRMGLYIDLASGGTFRFRDTIAPLPARKPSMSAVAIDLDRADLDAAASAGRPFVEALELRRTGAAGGAPIDARRLGELLYRSARVRSTTPIDPGAQRFYEITSRPYPSGGAIYDIELYLVVRACAGLADGAYHYDPFAHALERLAGPSANADAVLAGLARGSRLPGVPLVLIAMASRFQRRAWKYAGIAYANALKGAGVLQESMMLVATDMEMSAHPVAADESGFAAVTGLDPEVEGLVGGLLLAGGSERDA